MDGKRFLSSVKFTNLLSFGPDGMELELQPLNVLIGPNGSGKSNFIDAMRILQSIFVDINLPFSRGDIASEWVWKGGETRNRFSVEATFTGDDKFVAYQAWLLADKARPRFITERVHVSENNGYQFGESIDSHEWATLSMFFESGKTVGKTDDEGYAIRQDKEIAGLFGSLKDIRIYSDFEVGRYSRSRVPQNASLDPYEIFEGFGNIALVINDLMSKPEIIAAILEKLRLFYPSVVSVNTRIAFGTVQLYFQELGLSETVPATRLSDGTMRFLSLLAILLHPTPPPLICLEEPELGMHPDILPTIAELLIDASQRTQLIVTTHSDILLSAIGRTCPEAVVVCEKGPSGTRMTRPDLERLAAWIEEHAGLGDVWLSGLIGGTRW